MDRETYWLLDTVVEHPYSVSWLAITPQSDLERAFNRDHHNMSLEQLIDRLQHLTGTGLLRLYDDRDEQRTPVLATHAMRTAIIANTPPLIYALTQRGGQIWESVSSPQWHRYIDGPSRAIPSDPDADWDNNLSGPTRERIELYIHMLFPSHIYPEVITEESLRWDVHHPWQVTYWKTLPQGYTLHFKTRTLDVERWERAPSAEWRKQYDALTQWYTPWFVSFPGHDTSTLE